MPETVGQPEYDYDYAPVTGTREYAEALRQGLQPDAAMLVVQDPRYRAFLRVVSPMDWQVAANRPGLPIEVIVARLIIAGYPREQVMACVPLLERLHDDEVKAAVKRIGASDEVEEPEEPEPPRDDMRELRRVWGRGNPERPSQRPDARGARKRRQRAREKAAAATEPAEVAAESPEGDFDG